jgi:aldose 1-epimerase
MIWPGNFSFAFMLDDTGGFATGGETPKRGIQKSVFGKMPDGQEINLYTLRNSNGVQVGITNFGGKVVSLLVPDRHGKLADVVLGFDNLAPYLGNEPHFGTLIGRFANRIAGGRFTLEGAEYQLPLNRPPNTLHGGMEGFDRKVWTARELAGNSPGLELTYVSADGEEGFPGNLTAKAVYTLTDANELRLDYTAITDKTTVVNLTNHSYFNLAGHGNGDILGHVMMINADQFTPVDSAQIPTGEVRSVAGTPLDFRKPTAIGARIGQDDPQLIFSKGYDHNFVLNHEGPGLVLAARAVEPESGRVLEVLTTQPGVQLYTGNFLDGSIRGKEGKIYPYRSAFCLETQHFPDSPNHPNFPSAVLKPGQTYQETAIFRFSTAA